MDFIQCPHCQKKYTVSAQLRAAAGKRIRCKHCAEGFEIHVQQAPLPASAESSLSSAPSASLVSSQEPDIKMNSSIPNEPTIEHDEPTEVSRSEQQEKKKSTAEKKESSAIRPPKKKRNIQLLITIVLLIILIAGAGAAFLFFNKNSLFSDSNKKDKQTIIPHDIIKPVEIKLSAQPSEQANKRTATKAMQSARVNASPKAPQNASTAAPKATKASGTTASSEPGTASQVCKDISADYWIRSRTLAMASMDTPTYMKLLNQNLEQADEIRKLCKEKSLIGKIAKAARAAAKPAWIEQEINSRIDDKKQP